MANEFFREFQKSYFKNRSLEAEVTFKNGTYKIKVSNRGYQVFMVSSMSAYTAFSMALNKLREQEDALK